MLITAYVTHLCISIHRIYFMELSTLPKRTEQFLLSKEEKKKEKKEKG